MKYPDTSAFCIRRYVSVAKRFQEVDRNGVDWAFFYIQCSQKVRFYHYREGTTFVADPKVGGQSLIFGCLIFRKYA